MQVIICDCDDAFRMRLREQITNWMTLEKNPDVQIRSFRSSKDLIREWRSGLKAHIFFLDAAFPNEPSGMDVARIIRETDGTVPIVFITSHEEYAYEGYVYHALRYIIKPISDADMSICLNTAYHRCNLLHEDYVLLSSRSERSAFKYSEILYVDGTRSGVSIKTLRCIPTTMKCTLRTVLSSLPETLFTLCAPDRIVNISKICSLDESHIILCDDTVLPVSENCASTVYDKYRRFHQ